MDEDLLGCFGLGMFVGSFDELAALEAGTGADERDEVGCVDRTPVCLGPGPRRSRAPRGDRPEAACPVWRLRLH